MSRKRRRKNLYRKRVIAPALKTAFYSDIEIAIDGNALGYSNVFEPSMASVEEEIRRRLITSRYEHRISYGDISDRTIDRSMMRTIDMFANDRERSRSYEYNHRPWRHRTVDQDPLITISSHTEPVIIAKILDEIHRCHPYLEHVHILIGVDGDRLRIQIRHPLTERLVYMISSVARDVMSAHYFGRVLNEHDERSSHVVIVDTCQSHTECRQHQDMGAECLFSEYPMRRHERLDTHKLGIARY